MLPLVSLGENENVVTWHSLLANALLYKLAVVDVYLCNFSEVNGHDVLCAMNVSTILCVHLPEECEDHHCNNHGKCLQGTCSCQKGWSGKYCQIRSKQQFTIIFYIFATSHGSPTHLLHTPHLCLFLCITN